MPHIEANGISLYYEQDGNGSPLLFISGSGGDLRNKPNQFDSPLADAFKLIGYDQRGLGQSDKPEGAYTMAEYADDAAALLDALGLDRVPVVGVSFGGMVGQELVLRHPDRVEAIVLACTSSGGTGGASFPLHTLQHLPVEERVVEHLKVSDLRHTDEWISKNPEAWQRRIDMAIGAQRADRDEAGARKQLEARRHHDTYDRLEGISVPTLLAGGRYDGVAPPTNMEAMQEQIATSDLQFFEGGHMFLIQDKSAWPEIVRWLQKHC